MGISLITHFHREDYKTLNKLMEFVNEEKICRVPYGRVDNKIRYLVDTLPYHITISSSKESESDVLEKLSKLPFTPLRLKVIGIDVMRGRNNSRVLYLKVESSEQSDSLQWLVYHRLKNEKYKPGKSVLHITLCITKSESKLERIKAKLLENFNPFYIHVMSLGLYRIWPGVMISEYHTNCLNAYDSLSINDEDEIEDEEVYSNYCPSVVDMEYGKDNEEEEIEDDDVFDDAEMNLGYNWGQRYFDRKYRLDFDIP